MSDLLLLLGVAILGTLGHYFMTIALSLAPLSITQPVIFFQLIWSTIIGLLFDEFRFFYINRRVLIVIAIVRLSANENLSLEK